MAERIFTFTVEAAQHGWRLDRALSGLLTGQGVSREQIKKRIGEGRVRRNGESCSSARQAVREGDCLEISLPALQPEIVPEEGGVEVLYEDAHILVLNKPAGLTVHPCPSCPAGTLVHRLARLYPDLEGQGLRPGIVHRLDKDTSGLLLVARTEKDRLRLSRSFAAREVDKTYLALVHGVPLAAEAEINAPIGRHPTRKTCMAVHPGGREAVSRYRTVYADPAGLFALLEVSIMTGRTHQIRVHLSYLGHPLWGDTLYGGQKYYPAGPPGLKDGAAPGLPIAPRQMLHARQLSFRHPESGEPLSFCQEWPPDFAACLRQLLRQRQRVVITGLPGSGKSALAHDLAEAGLPVFSADAAVRRLYEPGAAGWDLLDRRFPGRFTPDSSQPVDRRVLATAMRADEALRREVEHLIHPLVASELEDFFAALPPGATGAAEVPLYFETGWHKRKTAASAGKFGLNLPRPGGKLISPGGQPLPESARESIIVLVICPERLRFARLAERGVPESLARTLTAWQRPEPEKRKTAHVLLDNGGSRAQLRAAALELADWLAVLAEAHVDAAVRKCWQAL